MDGNHKVTGTPRCDRQFGCHRCILNVLTEEMTEFRALLDSYLKEPLVFQQRMREKAEAMTAVINRWYSQEKEV